MDEDGSQKVIAVSQLTLVETRDRYEFLLKLIRCHLLYVGLIKFSAHAF